MAKSLGILVTNPTNMKHIMGVTKAAKAKGAKVKVFFTWKGTTLTHDPDYAALVKLADDVSICAASYKQLGYDAENLPAGLTADKMATQAQHGAIVEDYDCYMTF